MGAAEFITVGTGKTAKEAFRNAIEEALYEYGHGGYTGTIAEKDSFVIIEISSNTDPEEFANEILEENQDKICDKWGAAGCIELGKNKFLFFGIAST